jgi:hypothetical protein
MYPSEGVWNPPLHPLRWFITSPLSALITPDIPHTKSSTLFAAVNLLVKQAALRSLTRLPQPPHGQFQNFGMALAD